MGDGGKGRREGGKERSKGGATGPSYGIADKEACQSSNPTAVSNYYFHNYVKAAALTAQIRNSPETYLDNQDKSKCGFLSEAYLNLTLVEANER